MRECNILSVSLFYHFISSYSTSVKETVLRVTFVARVREKCMSHRIKCIEKEE